MQYSHYPIHRNCNSKKLMIMKIELFTNKKVQKKERGKGLMIIRLNVSHSFFFHLFIYIVLYSNYVKPCNTHVLH